MSRRQTKEWAGHSLEALQERWGRESVVLYGRIDSSNEAARQLADRAAPAGTVVLCREQTAGRGRAGRSWHSPRDAGVYLSLIFRPGDLSHPAMVSIMAGLGVVEALDSAFPGIRPGLKWPNDIIASDRKLGGVLAEASWTESHPRHLIVGVGLNVRPLASDAPDELKTRATALDSLLEGETLLVDVADAVIEGLEARLPDLPDVLAGSLLERVDRFDWLRDRRAALSPPGGTEGQRGTCVGIAPDGALLFRPDRGGLRRVQDGVVDPWA
jgi:BirA family biotin operon repressor/biotin-[acetyl-CoA-carboxylase] ligase